jgi:single-strand DNA-binding protein
MAIQEAYVSLIGFVATQPKKGQTKSGLLSLSMRVGWTPRTIDRDTGEWTDQPSSFITVQCYRRVAEHAGACLRRGEPVVLRGTLRIREYTDKAGQRRSAVEIVADSIGHDMSRGISNYSKIPTRTTLTADEYERAQAAEADRDPVPGDPGRAESDGGEDAKEPDVAQPDMTEEEFDESGERDVLARADDVLEPVGALA